MVIAAGEGIRGTEQKELANKDEGSKAGSYAKYENIDENSTSSPLLVDDDLATIDGKISGEKNDQPFQVKIVTEKSLKTGQ